MKEDRVKHGVYQYIKRSDRQFHEDWLSQNRPLPYYPIRMRKRTLGKSMVKTSLKKFKNK